MVGGIWWSLVRTGGHESGQILKEKCRGEEGMLGGRVRLQRGSGEV